MFAHALLTLYRSVTRHRLYAVINVLGLALGVAVFLVLMLVVRFQTSFEQWIPGSSQIYLIRTNARDQGWLPYTTGAMLDALRADYPQILGTRVSDTPASVRQGPTITAERVTPVDPTFFKVFDLPLVAGDRDRLLASPDNVVVSQAEARKYFGGANPMGRRLTISIQNKVRDYRVVGVIKDPPPTTDFKFDLITLLRIPSRAANPAWFDFTSMRTETYLRFATPASADRLAADLPTFIGRHARRRPDGPEHRGMTLRLTPVRQMHLIKPPGVAVAAATAAVAVLTLLLAAVNYVNLSTARASMRAKEVALRKVMGATRPGLIAQFVGESVVVALFGALLGLALCELVLPLFNAALGVTLKLDYVGDPWLAGLMAFVVLVVGLGAGFYPAFVLSRYQPASVLASARSPGGGRAGSGLREALVIFQFAIGIAFTIATAVILTQALFLRRVDIGFRREGLIEVISHTSSVSPAQRDSLLTAWRAEPGVIGAAQADTTPGDPDIPAAWTKQTGQAGPGSWVHFASIGRNFFQTFGVRLLAGRLPDPDRAADFAVENRPQPGVSNVVVNLRALKQLGFRSPEDAIGKSIVGMDRQFQVIGVVGDLRFTSPREVVEPIVYLSLVGGIEGSAPVVRYSGVDPAVMARRMADDWRRIVPTEPFEAKTIVAELEPYYRTDDQASRMLALAAVLAVLIGCIGLYGLASFNTAQRVREIGIRKTLGASTLDILRLLMGQFLRPVVLANLAAWPLAYLALRAYLTGFDQRVALGPAYFLIASVMTLAIAVVTVAGQALFVARAPPSKALRHE
jgi:putative ABC transport system permease protein